MAQAQVKTAKKISPYVIGGALVVGGVWLWTVLSKPKAGFKDLIAEYWSRVGGTEFTGLPGSLLPVIDGSEFGGTIKFKHQGPGGNYSIGFYADIEGYECWAGPVAIEIEEDDEWVEYTVEVSSTIDTRDLPHCRRIGTRKEIQSEGGDVVLDDDDDVCYHVISNGESNSIVAEEYWAEINGTKIAGLPGGLIPIADGATFGAKIRFSHRYLGGQFKVVSAIKVGDQWEKAEVVVELPTATDWNTYVVDIESTTPFSRHGLGHCTRLGTRNYILDESGDDLIGDDDAECYHIVERPEIPWIVVDEYWSEWEGVRYSGVPGSLLPIRDGSTFGARIKFSHRYLGGQFTVGSAIKVGDYWEKAETTVEIPVSTDLVEYVVNVQSAEPFDRHDLGHCTRLGTRNYVLDSEGNSIIGDDDAECYHIVEGHHFSNLVVGEYYADNREVGGNIEHTIPNGLTPLMPGGYFWAADVIFDYEGEGGDFNVGFNINVGGYREWSMMAVHIPLSSKERYTVWTEANKGTFDPRDQEICTAMGTQKMIQKANGDVVLANDDADCYHRVRSLSEMPEPQYSVGDIVIFSFWGASLQGTIVSLRWFEEAVSWQYLMQEYPDWWIAETMIDGLAPPSPPPGEGPYLVKDIDFWFWGYGGCSVKATVTNFGEGSAFGLKATLLSDGIGIADSRITVYNVPIVGEMTVRCGARTTIDVVEQLGSYYNEFKPGAVIIFQWDGGITSWPIEYLVAVEATDAEGNKIVV